MEESQYIGPKIIGLDNQPLISGRDWYPMLVREKGTGRTLNIKSIRFNPELHERIENEKAEKIEVKTEKAETRYESMPMKELRALVKDRGIKAPFGCKKLDLIKLLNQ